MLARASGVPGVRADNLDTLIMGALDQEADFCVFGASKDERILPLLEPFDLYLDVVGLTGTDAALDWLIARRESLATMLCVEMPQVPWTLRHFSRAQIEARMPRLVESWGPEIPARVLAAIGVREKAAEILRRQSAGGATLSETIRALLDASEPFIAPYLLAALKDHAGEIAPEDRARIDEWIRERLDRHVGDASSYPIEVWFAGRIGELL